MTEFEQTRLVRFEQGRVLFRQGEESRDMYIIRSGAVQVAIEKDGRLIPITILGKGCYVGEMSFLTGVPRSATVTVQEDITANVVTPDVLQQDAASISEWSLSIAKVLVERIRKTTVLIGGYLTAESAKAEPAKQEQKVSDEFAIGFQPDLHPARLFLKGNLKEPGVNQLKEKIRELRLKQYKRIVLDFSEVLDIDNAGLNYLFDLTQDERTDDDGVYIENVQLVRSKVLYIKGILTIIAESHPPQKRVEQGQLLIRQGKLENVMYVVKTGSFTVLREVHGKSVELSKVQAGDVIGEMALIKEGPRSASVRADQASVVYVIDTQDFYKNMYSVPKWFFDVIRGLVRRLRHTNHILESLVDNRKKKEKKKTWNHPLGIVVDSENPGKMILQGELILDTIEYLTLLIQSVTEKGMLDITLDLNRVKTIDRESIMYLLHLNVDLSRRGGSLTLLGPHKDILKMKEHYERIL